MGQHSCRYPVWHTLLVLCGTAAYWWGSMVGALLLWGKAADGEPLFWGIVVWLVSTWLVKHLLQWRCQGHQGREGRRTLAVLGLLASVAYLGNNDNR